MSSKMIPWLVAALLLLAACREPAAEVAPTPLPEPATATSLATAAPAATSTSAPLAATETPPPPTAAPKPTATLPAPSPTSQSPFSGPTVAGRIALRELPGAGRGPVALALLDGRLYVANLTTANLSVIEEERVTRVIPLGASPVALWADEGSASLYVSSERDDSISVVAADRAKGESLARTLRVEQGPAALLGIEGRLLVGAASGVGLWLLDPATGEVLQEVALDFQGEIVAMAHDPRANLLFLNLYGETWAIDTRTWKPLYRLSLNGYHTLAASPRLGRFYVNDYDAAANQQYLVAVRSEDGQVLERLPIGGDPRGAAVNAATGRVYVANSWTNDVTVIEEEPYRLLATVPVGLRPVALAVDERRNRIYVACGDSNQVTVIDGETNRVVGVVPLAMDPQGIAVDERTGRAYIANPSTNSVFVSNKGLPEGEIPVGIHPVAVAVDEAKGLLYVANKGDGTASVVDLGSGQVRRTLAIGGQPETAAVDPGTNRAYVGDAVIDRDSLEVVGRLRWQATALGLEIVPRRIVADPTANRLYVAAFNGIPGSNGGDMIYALDSRSFERLPASLGGVSTIDLALDAAAGRLYSVAGRFGSYTLHANDLKGGAAQMLDLTKQPRALAYSPTTDHLFVALIEGARPDVDRSREIHYWRGKDLADLGSLPFTGSPNAMAVDRATGLIYLSDAASGQVVMLLDVP